MAYRLRSQDKAKQGERSKDKLLKRHRGHNSNVFNKLKMDQNIFQFYKQPELKQAVNTLTSFH